MSTAILFDAPGEDAVKPRATKVFLAIEIPEDILLPEHVWPHGDPGEGWDAHAVHSEMRIQYGDSVSLRKLVDEWGVGDGGGALILRDDAGNLIRMELRP